MSAQARLSDLDIDKVIHEKARLLVLTYLASSDSPETGFTELRDALLMTSGNLSIQLRTLEVAGYIGITKSYKDNKPYTGIKLSVEGRKALDGYLGTLETILAMARPARKEAP
ncbi:MAG TPA: transcriptional regulator [bacterium]|nr:transcriptional regulator [bacterium]